MSKIDENFKSLCSDILANGRDYENKNRGVTRKQIPSHTFKHSFADGFPALSLKKLPFKSVIAELVWFLRGDNDVEYLNDNGVTIWNKDAYNWYCKDQEYLAAGKIPTVAASMLEDRLTLEEFSKLGRGSVGQNYSVQWRKFNGKTDQLLDLINGMLKDVMSSRLKMNAWNPSEIFETALPPCHSEVQVVGIPLTPWERMQLVGDQFKDNGTYDAYSDKFLTGTANFINDPENSVEVSEILRASGVAEFGFELHWNQRSVDTFLGLPFNIASYGLLAKILESFTGYKALGIEGTLKCVHFYDNQFEEAKSMVNESEEFEPCTLDIDIPTFRLHENITVEQLNRVLDNISIKDFKLNGYTSGKARPVEMLAPKTLK